MPIRKRLTGQAPAAALANVAKQTTFDTPPLRIVFQELTHLKPRALFRHALNAIPVGEVMRSTKFNTEWVLPYLKQKFVVKGVPLAIYPVGTRLLSDGTMTKVTGAQVSVMIRHPKTGMSHVVGLKADMHEMWYTLVMNYLEEQGYIAFI